MIVENKRRMLARAIGFLTVTLLVIGCSKKPPECGSDEAVSLLNNIFKTQLLPEKFRSLPDFSSFIKWDYMIPTKLEENISKYSCTGRLHINAAKGVDSSSPQALIMTSGGSNSFVTDQKGTPWQTIEISYSIQKVGEQTISSVDPVGADKLLIAGALLKAHVAPSPAPTSKITQEITNGETFGPEHKQLIWQANAGQINGRHSKDGLIFSFKGKDFGYSKTEHVTRRKVWNSTDATMMLLEFDTQVANCRYIYAVIILSPARGGDMTDGFGQCGTLESVKIDTGNAEIAVNGISREVFRFDSMSDRVDKVN